MSKYFGKFSFSELWSLTLTPVMWVMTYFNTIINIKLAKSSNLRLVLNLMGHSERETKTVFSKWKHIFSVWKVLLQVLSKEIPS